MNHPADPAAGNSVSLMSEPLEGESRKSGKLFAIVLGALIATISGGLVFYARPRPKLLTPTLQMPSGDMVLIPAGRFAFGEGEEKEERFLPAFYIDRSEVSKAVYADFCRTTNRDLPTGFDPAKPDAPVSNVDMEDAQAFARWADKRVPVSLEWEKAAKSSGLVRFSGDKAELVLDRTTPNADQLAEYSRKMASPPSSNTPWFTLRLGPNRWTGVPLGHKSPEITFRCVKSP